MTPANWCLTLAVLCCLGFIWLRCSGETLPQSPAGRLAMIQELYAPWYEDEDGVYRAHPGEGLISAEEARRLLE
jgi:hypothetical protein